MIMSDVSIIGLGAMGSAIARKLLANGLTVTAWNRTITKARELEPEGISAVGELSEAIRASERVIVCVIDYDASKSLFEQPGIADSLDGRSVLQLTGGTPANASDAGEWMHSNGTTYMDGAIMCYPVDLGAHGSQILVAGPEAGFSDWQETLSFLAKDLRYVGSNIRAAKTLDMALLSRFVGLKFSAMHGARICESEDVSLLELANLLPDGDNAKRMIETIASEDFTLRSGSASVDVAAAVWGAMQSQAVARGINSELPDLFMSWCQAGIDQGWSNLDNACLIKVLRSSNPN
jgi:3-hydroxyisobutyrate dehydrogenase-like beta-hydroxyacid dehydrogenase